MPPVDYPAFDFTPLRFEDRTAAFAEAVKAAGGQVVAADGNPLTELIRRYYPDAKTIASVLPEAHATINPDTVDDARKLIDIDLGVIDGCFGVAENGAVWIRQDTSYKTPLFCAGPDDPHPARCAGRYDARGSRPTGIGRLRIRMLHVRTVENRRYQNNSLVFQGARSMSVTAMLHDDLHLSTPHPLSGTFSQVPDSSLYDSSVSSVKFPWPTCSAFQKRLTIFNYLNQE